MMKRLATVPCLALLVLLLNTATAEDGSSDNYKWLAAFAPAQPPVVNWSKYCAENCDRRCAKASEQDRCLKYCGICCDKCHCVPPGTAGNKDVCPCYRDLKNSKRGPKCP